MPRISTTVCRICLSSDLANSKVIDERLVDLHDELCEYDVFDHYAVKFCSICEYQLRKFYNFREKCRRAHSILKTCKQTKNPVQYLDELMPPSSLKICTSNSRQKVYDYVSSDLEPYVRFNEPTYVVTIKEESDDTIKILEDPLSTQEIRQSKPEYNLLTHDLEANDLPTHDLEVNDLPTHDLEVNDLPTHDFEVNAQQENDLEDNESQDIDSDENDSQAVYLELYDLSESNTQENDLDEDESQINFKDNNLEENDLKDNLLKRKLGTGSNDQKGCNVEYMDDETDDKKIIIKSNIKSVPKLAQKRKIKQFEEDGLSHLLCVEDLKFLGYDVLTKSDKRILRLKSKVLELLELGEFQDLGDGVTMNREVFLNMFGKCEATKLLHWCRFKQGPAAVPKLRKFLLHLVKWFDPAYDAVFDIEYCITRDQKLAEFNRRRHSKEYTEALYKCSLCFKSFEFQKMLDYHSKWHESGRPHACDICPMRFKSSKNLREHLGGDHYSVFRCRLCPLVTRTRDVMVNHYQQHAGTEYKCDVCARAYNSSSALRMHRLTHARHACPLCARRFVSGAGLRCHTVLKHSSGEPTETVSEGSQHLPCNKCDATFKSAGGLLMHSKIHDETRVIRCRRLDCSETFSSVAALRQHYGTEGHAGRRPPGAAPRSPSPARPASRTCPICGEEVRNFRTALYRHYQQAHPGAAYCSALPTKHLCAHCGKGFNVFSSYKDHMNVHSGTTPYACVSCPQRCSTRTALYMHARQHAPARHECACGAAFRTRAHLQQHQKGHIGDRRFVCEYCSKGFLYKGALTAHVKGVHFAIRRVKKKKTNK